jgi:NitT/TauT family transport system substrate-binding protein
MAENVEALRAGEADAVQLFEPFVEDLVDSGDGHAWYAAAARGPTSYTTLFTTRRKLQDRRDDMLAMTRALYRTQKWLHAQDARVIAEAIADFFPDIAKDQLTACIGRYKAFGIWGRDPILSRDGFERLRAACLSGGLITRAAAFDDCVDTSLACAVLAESPASP